MSLDSDYERDEFNKGKSKAIETLSRLSGKHHGSPRISTLKHKGSLTTDKLRLRDFNFLDEKSTEIYFWLLFLEEEVKTLKSLSELIDNFHEIEDNSEAMQRSGTCVDFNGENFLKTHLNAQLFKKKPIIQSSLDYKKIYRDIVYRSRVDLN